MERLSYSAQQGYWAKVIFGGKYEQQPSKMSFRPLLNKSIDAKTGLS